MTEKRARDREGGRTAPEARSPNPNPNPSTNPSPAPNPNICLSPGRQRGSLPVLPFYFSFVATGVAAAAAALHFPSLIFFRQLLQASRKI